LNAFSDSNLEDFYGFPTSEMACNGYHCFVLLDFSLAPQRSPKVTLVEAVAPQLDAFRSVQLLQKHHLFLGILQIT